MAEADADNHLLADTLERGLGITRLELALVIGAVGRTVAEGVTEDQPRAVIIEFAAEIPSDRIIIVGTQSGQSHGALNGECRQ